MVNNDELNDFNNDEKKKKKKRFLLILFLILFLVPIGFGIYALIPERPTPTPVVTYEVQLVNNYDGGLTLSQNTAYKNRTFSADIKINRSIIPDKFLPDSLSSSDVLCIGNPISYSYKLNTDKLSARIAIPSENIKGDITINVPLVTPTGTFPIVLKANGGRFKDNKTEITLNGYAGCRLIDFLDSYTRPTNFREGYHFTHWEQEDDRSVKLTETDVVPFSPNGVTYVANCDLNVYHVSFKGNGGKFNGQDTLDLDYCYDDVINLHDGYVDPTYEGHTFLYYEVTDVSNENQKFYPTDRIVIDKAHEARFGLRAIYANNLEITFNVDGGHFSDGDTTKNISAYDGITIKQIEEKYGVDLTPISDSGASFVCYKNGGDSIYPSTPLYGSLGTLTLSSNFSQCEHTSPYVNFAVDDNHVYGICPDCHKPILLTDEELETASAKKAILVPDENDPTFFRESDQQEVRQLIRETTGGKTLHLYLIGENFELNGSRDGGIVNVHLHGVLNSKDEKISSFQCYGVNGDGTKTYVGYGGMHLITENLIMNGSLECGNFYLGVQSDYLTCIDCDFKGVQSFYSPGEVICTNCTFDSSMLEYYNKLEAKWKSEYSIYSYAPYNVEFNQCHFISRGKALKLYTEGFVKNAVYKLNECTFKVVDEKLEDKAAIQVDSNLVENYDIYITRCTQEGHTAGLYNDTGTHAHFIVN